MNLFYAMFDKLYWILKQNKMNMKISRNVIYNYSPTITNDETMKKLKQEILWNIGFEETHKSMTKLCWTF